MENSFLKMQKILIDRQQKKQKYNVFKNEIMYKKITFLKT